VRELRQLFTVLFATLAKPAYASANTISCDAEMILTGTGDAKAARMLASFARAPNGFNTIRLIAASAVILSHSFVLTAATEPLAWLTNHQTTIGELSVAAFFLISGFLIPASLDRGSLGRYAVKRIRRIMPGLIAAVLICAFVLGPLLTSLPLGEYLRHSTTWRFIGNIAFLPTGYDLPGVYQANPLPAVNGSLWSLKFEMGCYIMVPVLLAVSRFRKAAVIAAWVASFPVARILGSDASGVFYFVYQFAALFRFFGMGMALYLFADRIPVRTSWGWIALALTMLAAFTPVFMEVAAIAGCYALVVFAYSCSDRFRQLTEKGDISYGVYVYAFPIQQLLVPLSLSVGGASYAWAINSAATAPVVALAGLASWLWVEKPAIKSRGKVLAAGSVS